MTTGLFDLLCGRYPGHVWAPGGELLPLCQRCTGLYAGALAAVVAQGLFRPRASTRYLQAHGLLLLQMAVFGTGLVEQDGCVRTITGALFGYGLVAFLRGPLERTTCPGSLPRYASLLAAALFVIPLAGAYGGMAGRGMLTAASVLGLIALAALAVANLVAATRVVFRRLTRTAT